jgi:hypothetical protein
MIRSLPLSSHHSRFPPPPGEFKERRDFDVSELDECGEVGGVAADSRRRAGALRRRRQVEEEAAGLAFGCGLELEGWGVHALDVVDHGDAAGVEGHACFGDRLERADIDGDFEVLIPFGSARYRGRHGCAPH